MYAKNIAEPPTDMPDIKAAAVRKFLCILPPHIFSVSLIFLYSSGLLINSDTFLAISSSSLMEILTPLSKKAF